MAAVATPTGFVPVRAPDDMDTHVAVPAIHNPPTPPAILLAGSPRGVKDDPWDRWSLDVGTGYAVSVDPLSVRSVAAAAELMLSFEPLLRGGRTMRGIPSAAAITQKLEELELVFNPRSNETAANRLCNDFAVFPPEAIEQDRDSLRRLLSLEKVIAEKHQITAAAGFNVDRVRAHVSPDNPHYDVLVRLAEHGADVFVPPSFVPTTSPPVPRSNLGRLANVFRYHAYKVWKGNKAVLVRWDDIPPEDRARMHFNHPHVAVKVDDPMMRFIIDPSNAPEGFCVLNTPEAKALSDAAWGVVRNPTISEIYTDMYAYCDEHNVNMSDCRLWKDDISGAFPQFRWSSATAMLMAKMIDPEYVLLSINGNFGHLSSPSIWEVIALAIKWECQNTLSFLLGLLWKYVDDYMGFAEAARAQIDQENFRRKAEEILAPGAINRLKMVEPTLRCDLLGWDTNLATELAGPNQKGCDKLLHCFCRIDVAQELSKDVWQVLASIAERYSAGLLAMRSFVSPLHHMVQLYGNKSANKKARIRTSSAARQCVEVWRAVAIMLFADKEAMLVPMRHMTSRRPPNSPFSLIADAGPAGVGAGILGPSGELVAYTAVTLPFRPDVDDKFHNLREFTGLLVNLTLFVKWARLHESDPLWKTLRGTETLIQWNSDSTTAISWVHKMKCNSRCGQHASFALTWFQLVAGITVSGCTHITGDRMIETGIDALSRNQPHNLDPRLYFDLSDCTPLFDVLRVCDPSGVHDLADHHTAFMYICSKLALI